MAGTPVSPARDRGVSVRLDVGISEGTADHRNGQAPGAADFALGNCHCRDLFGDRDAMTVSVRRRGREVIALRTITRRDAQISVKAVRLRCAIFLEIQSI